MAHVKDVGFAENFLKRDGRLNRWRFFKRNLAVALMAFVPLFLILLLFSDKPGQPSTLGVILMDGLSLVLLYPYYCLTVRRLHDLNKGEKLAQIYAAIYIAMMLLQGTDLNADSPSIVEGILGLVNGVICIYLLFFPGTKGDNNYGSDPLE